MGSVSITSKSFEGRYFKFTVSQSGTSTSVTWKFEVLGGSSTYYTASPITLKINGTTVWSKSSITYWNDYVFPATTGSTSGTHSIGSYGSFTVQLIGNPNWHAAETVSGTVTLDRPTYPVYYNTMGGSGTFSAQTKTYGYNLTLHSHKPTKTGYTFQGWATSSGSSTVAYAAGATYTGNARLDLFAVWKADTYAVTYNANGGSGAPANQTKTYGVTLKLQTGVPTRTNYNFLGWGTSASATTVAYAPGANYTGNTRLDLYAIWELAYVKPRITNLLVDRCDSGGTPTEEGTYAVVAFNWATDRDVTSVKIEWKLASATSYPSGNSKTVSASGTSGTVNTVVGSGAISADNTYTLKVTVADSIDNSNETRTLSSMEFTLDLLAGGKGAAFGKAAELENTLEVDWDLQVNGQMIPREITDNTDLNTIVEPGIYVCYTSATAKTLANCPTDIAFSLEVLRAASGGGSLNNVVQRLTTYHPTLTTEYRRTIYAGEIGEWRRSVDNNEFAIYDSGYIAVNSQYGKSFTVCRLTVPPGRYLVVGYLDANSGGSSILVCSVAFEGGWTKTRGGGTRTTIESGGGLNDVVYGETDVTSTLALYTYGYMNASYQVRGYIYAIRLP